MFRSIPITLTLLLLSPAVVCADSGSALAPSRLWQAWNWDWLILFNLSMLGWFYARGLSRLWSKAGMGRAVSRAQAAAFYLSLLVILVALISPLDALSDELAAAHMVQHMLLMVVAAPLLVLGAPGFVLNWGLARRWRRAAGKWRQWLAVDALNSPWLPWLLYGAALWLWHLPAAYQAALFDPLVHDAQHLTFFVAACLFWRVLLHPLRCGVQPITAVILLFTTSLHATLLGVFMTLSPAIWYEVYAPRTPTWGLSPLADQQLAGLIMWMPACLIYPALAAATLGRWLVTLSANEAAGPIGRPALPSGFRKTAS